MEEPVTYIAKNKMIILTDVIPVIMLQEKKSVSNIGMEETVQYIAMNKVILIVIMFVINKQVQRFVLQIGLAKTAVGFVTRNFLSTIIATKHLGWKFAAKTGMDQTVTNTVMARRKIIFAIKQLARRFVFQFGTESIAAHIVENRMVRMDIILVTRLLV